MQYWLGGSDDNVEAMVRFLIDRYADPAKLNKRKYVVAAPIEYPDVGLYHPKAKGRIVTDLADLPKVKKPKGVVGLLMMRSYILSSDCAHYDAVIEALEAQGLKVIPAFAGGLDGRPAIDEYFGPAGVDALVSLTGFSLIGGPAYNDSEAAIDALAKLDAPYICAQPLEFQSLDQWQASDIGLGPIEATMLVALPEIDGAIAPTVFGGRRAITGAATHAMAAAEERVQKLAARVAKIVALRRKPKAKRKVAIVLYGFPPNAGAMGTAAYLSVFESLYNTLHRLKAEGYEVDPPETVEALREIVLQGDAERYGQEANVLAHVPTDKIVTETPWLAELEAQWGPAPGVAQADGRGVFVLGARFGEVIVACQPAFGYEGDPMRFALRKGLRAEPCVFGLLSLVADGLSGRRPFAFRHARRAGVHAGPSDWP